jgi:hypothetical protein
VAAAVAWAELPARWGPTVSLSARLNGLDALEAALVQSLAYGFLLAIQSTAGELHMQRR